MGGVLFLDTSSTLCGWCAGDGSDTPTADAFALPDLEAGDLGALAVFFSDTVAALIHRFQPQVVAYESPIHRRTDKLSKIRRLYGFGWELEAMVIRINRLGLYPPMKSGEVDLRLIKSWMAGDPHADKKDVAATALRMGITLPPTIAQGRHDAGDAFGGWMITMAQHFPEAASPWMARLKGTLL